MARSVAVVDMGTNTLKFSVTFVEDDGRQTVVHSRADTIRLGAGIATSGKIDPARIDRTLASLRSYESVARAFGAESCIGVATAALRMARNGDDLLDQISRTTGWKVEVISGVEEAELTYHGLVDELPHNGGALLVDVGGGSTEFVAVQDRAMVASESVEIGSGTLADRCFHVDPPGIPAVESAVEVASGILGSSSLLDSVREPSLFLSGGNGQFLRQLAEWPEISIPFSPSGFPRLLATIAELESSASATYLGIVEERARMLPAGGAIALAVIGITSPASIVAAPSGIRGGLVKQWLGSNPA